jgi:hypothetical protein
VSFLDEKLTCWPIEIGTTFWGTSSIRNEKNEANARLDGDKEALHKLLETPQWLGLFLWLGE